MRALIEQNLRAVFSATLLGKYPDLLSQPEVIDFFVDKLARSKALAVDGNGQFIYIDRAQALFRNLSGLCASVNVPKRDIQSILTVVIQLVAAEPGSSVKGVIQSFMRDILAQIFPSIQFSPNEIEQLAGNLLGIDALQNKSTGNGVLNPTLFANFLLSFFKLLQMIELPKNDVFHALVELTELLKHKFSVQFLVVQVASDAVDVSLSDEGVSSLWMPSLAHLKAFSVLAKRIGARDDNLMLCRMAKYVREKNLTSQQILALIHYHLLWLPANNELRRPQLHALALFDNDPITFDAMIGVPWEAYRGDEFPLQQVFYNHEAPFVTLNSNGDAEITPERLAQLTQAGLCIGDRGSVFLYFKPSGSNKAPMTGEQREKISLSNFDPRILAKYFLFWREVSKHYQHILSLPLADMVAWMQKYQCLPESCNDKPLAEVIAGQLVYQKSANPADLLDSVAQADQLIMSLVDSLLPEQLTVGMIGRLNQLSVFAKKAEILTLMSKNMLPVEALFYSFDLLLMPSFVEYLAAHTQPETYDERSVNFLNNFAVHSDFLLLMHLLVQGYTVGELSTLNTLLRNTVGVDILEGQVIAFLMSVPPETTAGLKFHQLISSVGGKETLFATRQKIKDLYVEREALPRTRTVDDIERDIVFYHKQEKQLLIELYGRLQFVYWFGSDFPSRTPRGSEHYPEEFVVSIAVQLVRYLNDSYKGPAVVDFLVKYEEVIFGTGALLLNQVARYILLNLMTQENALHIAQMVRQIPAELLSLGLWTELVSLNHSHISVNGQPFDRVMAMLMRSYLTVGGTKLLSERLVLIKKGGGRDGVVQALYRHNLLSYAEVFELLFRPEFQYDVPHISEMVEEIKGKIQLLYPRSCAREKFLSGMYFFDSDAWLNKLDQAVSKFREKLVNVTKHADNSTEATFRLKGIRGAAWESFTRQVVLNEVSAYNQLHRVLKSGNAYAVFALLSKEDFQKLAGKSRSESLWQAHCDTVYRELEKRYSNFQGIVKSPWRLLRFLSCTVLSPLVLTIVMKDASPKQRVLIEEWIVNVRDGYGFAYYLDQADSTIARRVGINELKKRLSGQKHQKHLLREYPEFVLAVHWNPLPLGTVQAQTENAGMRLSAVDRSQPDAQEVLMWLSVELGKIHRDHLIVSLSNDSESESELPAGPADTTWFYQMQPEELGGVQIERLQLNLQRALSASVWHEVGKPIVIFGSISVAGCWVPYWVAKTESGKVSVFTADTSVHSSLLGHVVYEAGSGLSYCSEKEARYNELHRFFAMTFPGCHYEDVGLAHALSSYDAAVMTGYIQHQVMEKQLIAVLNDRVTFDSSALGLPLITSQGADGQQYFYQEGSNESLNAAHAFWREHLEFPVVVQSALPGDQLKSEVESAIRDAFEVYLMRYLGQVLLGSAIQSFVYEFLVQPEIACQLSEVSVNSRTALLERLADVAEPIVLQHKLDVLVHNLSRDDALILYGFASESADPIGAILIKLLSDWENTQVTKIDLAWLAEHRRDALVERIEHGVNVFVGYQIEKIWEKLAVIASIEELILCQRALHDREYSTFLSNVCSLGGLQQCANLRKVVFDAAIARGLPEKLEQVSDDALNARVHAFMRLRGVRSEVNGLPLSAFASSDPLSLKISVHNYGGVDTLTPELAEVYFEKIKSHPAVEGVLEQRKAVLFNELWQQVRGRLDYPQARSGMFGSAAGTHVVSVLPVGELKQLNGELTSLGQEFLTYYNRRLGDRPEHTRAQRDLVIGGDSIVLSIH